MDTLITLSNCKLPQMLRALTRRAVQLSSISNLVDCKPINPLAENISCSYRVIRLPTPIIQVLILHGYCVILARIFAIPSLHSNHLWYVMLLETGFFQFWDFRVQSRHGPLCECRSQKFAVQLSPAFCIFMLQNHTFVIQFYDLVKAKSRTGTFRRWDHRFLQHSLPSTI